MIYAQRGLSNKTCRTYVRVVLGVALVYQLGRDIEGALRRLEAARSVNCVLLAKLEHLSSAVHREAFVLGCARGGSWLAQVVFVREHVGGGRLVSRDPLGLVQSALHV